MVLFEIWSLGHKPFNDLTNAIVSLTFQPLEKNASIERPQIVFFFLFGFKHCFIVIMQN